MLSRLYGAQLCYTPSVNISQVSFLRTQSTNSMINAGLFNPQHPQYCEEAFNLSEKEEGRRDLDRPVIAQFCANDPLVFYQAAMLLASSGAVDAIDLNLGCPQNIAKRGKYGAFLMEDWKLIESMSVLSLPLFALYASLTTLPQSTICI